MNCNHRMKKVDKIFCQDKFGLNGFCSKPLVTVNGKEVKAILRLCVLCGYRVITVKNKSKKEVVLSGCSLEFNSLEGGIKEVLK